MNRLLIPALAALLSLPAATAAWQMQGSAEPDTTQDKSDGWMYQTPDTTATNLPTPSRKVYFNGWMSSDPLTHANPNAATAKSAFRSASEISYAAMGVWKDCNRDGFVGHGERGLWEYPAQLVDTSVCKVQALPAPTPQGRLPFNVLPPHNDGQWVHEFIPIVWNQANAEQLGDTNWFNINDNASRVWMDWNLPGTNLTGPTGCYVNPPTGALRSTGGAVKWLDCHAGARATTTLTDLANRRACVLDTCQALPVGIDETPAGQLSFRDKPSDQGRSTSKLNVANPWGRESDPSNVQMWDCTPGTQVRSVRVDDQTYVNVSRPRVPPSAGTSGSPAGTMNATGSGFDECNRSTANNGHSDPVTGIVPTHWGQVLAAGPYNLEAAVENGEAGKITVEDTLTPPFIEATRPQPPYATLLGKGAPPIGSGFFVFDGAEGFWSGSVNHLTFGTPDATLRTGLTLAPPGVAPSNDIMHMTYYGFVSDPVLLRHGLSLPKGTTKGIYGSATCPIIGAGAPNAMGWACDPAKWYVNDLGADEEPRSTFLGPGDSTNGGVRIGVRVGASYNLRDIDCTDWSVASARSAGVYWGTLGGRKCV